VALVSPDERVKELAGKLIAVPLLHQQVSAVFVASLRDILLLQVTLFGGHI
jgi:hypothetical protein